MSENYDVQQVCENGHQITGCYNYAPEDRKEFCTQCGAKTTITCPKCKEKIQGDKLGQVRMYGDEVEPIENSVVPLYCLACGEPYPWTKNKIINAIQILIEFGDLEDKEKETIEQDVENIAKDVPEAELSALRIKRIWKRGKAVGYEAIMEFASRTAAKILKD
jgi:hypothetical protein